MADLSGQVIKGYELHERIGAGGFGAVYRANQTSIGREVAIKLILAQYITHPEFSRRFESEAQLIARLEHPHIVPLFDYWREADGSAYLVMRWLKGGSLRSRLASGPLSHYEAARVATQIGEALAVAHRQGVIHRDLKPGNILLDEHGNAYLSDFGIAKDLMIATEITTDGQTPSTPAYAAPEQVSGQPVTPQSDIYSFTITLYECLAGEHPFPNAHLRHLYDSIPALHEKRAEIPAELDVVMAKATLKDATGRYMDVSSFVRAFREALKITGDSFSFEESTTIQQGARVLAEVLPTLVVTPVHGAAAATHSTLHGPGEQSASLIETLEDVPTRPEKLVGREGLLEEIQKLLEKGDKVLLQGLGGMGKTALAAEAVVRFVAAGKQPILWLHANSDNSGALLEALVRPFQAHSEVASTQVSQQTQAVRRVLTERQVKLVVFDDVWDGKVLKRLVDAVPKAIPVLVTSRQRYPVGHILDVGELGMGEAVTLLNHHARASDTNSKAAELCQKLGYHPFALEIAGKTLQVDELSPGDLLQRIAESPHLITMPEGFADEGRETVQQLLDASTQALEEKTRDVFMAFGGVFVPSATPDLLAFCLKRDLKEIQDALTALGRRGLAKRVRLPKGEVDTYRLHTLAHSYTRAASAISNDAAIEGCCDYVVKFKGNLNALDAERANMLHAAQEAYHLEKHDSVIAIMRGLIVDGPYLSARGHDSMLLEQLDHAIEAARKSGESSQESLHRFLGKRGDAYYERGELAKALEYYEKSLELARMLKLKDREVILLCVSSKVYSDLHQFEEAERRLAEAFGIATSANDDMLLVRVLEHQGYHYAHAKQDFKAAHEVYSKQVALAERLNDGERLFFALQNLGGVELESGQLQAAIVPLERSLKMAREQDNHQKIAHALYPMGKVYNGLNERNKAQTCLDEALSLYRQIGNTARVNELIAFMSKFEYAIKAD